MEYFHFVSLRSFPRTKDDRREDRDQDARGAASAHNLQSTAHKTTATMLNAGRWSMVDGEGQEDY